MKIETKLTDGGGELTEVAVRAHGSFVDCDGDVNIITDDGKTFYFHDGCVRERWGTIARWVRDGEVARLTTPGESITITF